MPESRFSIVRSLGRAAGLTTAAAAIGAFIAVLSAGVVDAQEKKPYPIFTADQFVAAMKTVGQAFTAVNGSLSKSEYDDAKAYLAISRDRLATTIQLWRDRGKDDAVKMLRDVLKQMDALDAALSVDQVDAANASAIAKQVGAGCEACHQVYREQDPQTKAYKIKAGSTD
jgi:cytochrome c556